jgi:FkbM family methyltransferase
VDTKDGMDALLKVAREFGFRAASLKTQWPRVWSAQPHTAAGWRTSPSPRGGRPTASGFRRASYGPPSFIARRFLESESAVQRVSDLALELLKRFQNLEADVKTEAMDAISQAEQQLRSDGERILQLQQSIQDAYSGSLLRARSKVEITRASSQSSAFSTERDALEARLNSVQQRLTGYERGVLSDLQTRLAKIGDQLAVKRGNLEKSPSGYTALLLRFLELHSEVDKAQAAIEALLAELSHISEMAQLLYDLASAREKTEGSTASLRDLADNVAAQTAEFSSLKITIASLADRSDESLRSWLTVVLSRLEEALAMFKSELSTAGSARSALNRDLLKTYTAVKAIAKQVATIKLAISALPEQTKALLQPSFGTVWESFEGALDSFKQQMAALSSNHQWVSERIAEVTKVIAPLSGELTAQRDDLSEIRKTVAESGKRWGPVYLGENRLLVQSVRAQPLICFASDLELSPCLASQGILEPALTVLVHEFLRPGMRAMDVGAHIGYYTVLMAGLVGSSGEVYSFEPVPGNFQLLKENCLLNHCAHVCRLFNTALGKEEGTGNIHVFPHDTASSTFAQLPGSLLQFWPSRPRTEAVSITTLDQVMSSAGFPPFDFIKMDVEGAESLVLEGGTEFLRKCLLPHTVIALELNPLAMAGLGIEPTRLVELLDRQGFRLHVLEAIHSERPLEPTDLHSAINRQLIARRKER